MGLIIKDFVLNKVNKIYFLPSIQREFVWLNNPHDKKIEKLFDSIFQDYPIGNLLIWNFSKDPDKTNLDFEVYEFINKWDKRDTENPKANLNGRTDLKLVLDGQQRLTALFIGLNGSITAKKYKSTSTKKLYINLFSDIEAEKDNTYGWNYEIEFLDENIDITETTRPNYTKFWFEIGKVLDYEDAEDLKEAFYSEIIGRAKGRPEEQKLITKAMKTLGIMHHVICTKDTCIVENETNTKDNEKALDIFIRTNDGATKLEKSDMLLSYMEANHDLFPPDGARKEVKKLLNDMNKEKRSKLSYSFDSDFILKASLVLSDLPVQYRLKSFNKENLQKISDNWANIKKFLVITADLLGKAGFSDSNIISRNALIPIAYYLMKKGKGWDILDSNSQEDIDIKRDIYRWFIIATFKKMFGSSSDTTLVNVRNELKENKPLIEVLEGSHVTKDEIKNIVKGARYGKPNTRLILMLISDVKYLDDIDEDHIYPQKELSRSNLNSLRLDIQQIDKFLNLTNSIGNLQLLGSQTNIKKSDERFIDWKNKQDKRFLKSMLVPDLEDYSILNFDNFVEKREEMIVDKMYAMLKNDNASQGN